MQERRLLSGRRACDIKGSIALEDGLHISCDIENLSNTGAKPRIFQDVVRVPETFVVTYHHEGIDKTVPVKLKWKTAGAIGVSFQETHNGTITDKSADQFCKVIDFLGLSGIEISACATEQSRYLTGLCTIGVFLFVSIFVTSRMLANRR